MTISTSSSARHTACVGLVLVLALVLATAVLLIWMTALGERAQHVAEHAVTGDAVAEENAAVAAEDAAAAARVVATLGPSGKELLSTLYVNFDLATRGADPGKSRMAAMPRNNEAGIACSPAALDGSTPTLRMVLPESFAARNTALVALTPDGSLRIVYMSYGPDIESGDLIIPSRSIDWERARTRNDFVVDVDKFEASRPDEDVPEPLFRQAGIYQFALVNGVDRELLEVNGAAFWVIAGCVVHYQP